MDKTFSDETLRKALSLNLIKLPDGIDNIYEINNKYRSTLTFELIQKLSAIQKTETLTNKMDILDIQKYAKKSNVVTFMILILIAITYMLTSFDVIDKKLGVILMSLLIIVFAIDTMVSITIVLRKHFKMIRKQVAQGTLMVDEIYQRQFNNNSCKENYD